MAQSRRRGAGIAAVAVAGVVLGTAFGPSLATAGIETAKDVFIVNDEDGEAVPTRAVGTTRVVVTGTEKPVVVEPVAPVVTPIAEQLRWGFSGEFSAGATYDVPAGKRLTIDFVSAADSGRASVGFENFGVRATTAGQRVSHQLLTEKQGSYTDVVSQSLRIVADPGTQVLFGLELDGPLGGHVTQLLYGSFTGTLTDVAP